jgi:uncharacterized membrane protein YfcA
MISPWLYPLLFVTAFVAGFVDSIAGGGGLITIPVLLSLGLTPQDALGTNKLQSTFGSGSATWHYGRAGLIDFKACFAGIGFTAVGAGLGTWLVVTMGRNEAGKDVLRQIIPWLIIAIALYMLLQPKIGETDLRPRMTSGLFHFVFGLGLGFYDGFFGPGTGTFWALAYMVLLGFNMTRATAHTKLMNFTSNVVSLGAFLAAGHAYFGAGLCMGAGAWLGARLGSRVAIKKGVKFIRPVFIVVALVITARLLWKNFSKAAP